MTDDARAAVDNSAWDGNQAMVDAGAADDPAAAFRAICAGQRAGDTSQRQTWALPHHAHPDDPPNAAGVRDAESRIGQAQGLINREAAQRHLDAHMATIQAPRSASPPRDNLVRAQPGGFELRETTDGMPTLTGHFAVFNEWTKIDSAYEGVFMERVAPGAFSKTFAEGAGKIRVLFQHGKDPHIGDKVLGMPGVLEEDAVGARYEVPLFDTTYNRDLLPGLRAGAYGSSFRFRVTREDMVRSPKATGRNPDALPERTIREAEVMEFGPVTFPAYAGATAGIRSMTDEYVFDTITADPARLRELVAYIEPAAPSADAGAQPHLVPERRTTPVPVPTPTPKGKPTVEYVTREEKASRVTELKAALARQAVEFPGVLPTEAQTTWDSDSTELDTLERDIAAWDNRQARLAAYAEDATKTERYTAPQIVRTKSVDDIYDIDAIYSRSRSTEQRGQTLRDNAMRSLDQATFPHPASRPDEARAHIANLLDYNDSAEKELAQRILITGSPTYRRQFNKRLLGQHLTPEEERVGALAVVGTTVTGGDMVPYVFDPTIVPIGAWTSINPYRAACTVKQIVGGNLWTAVAVGPVTAVRAAEAAVAVESGPVFEAPSITVNRVQTLITYSIETEQDRPDIASEMAKLIQESKDTEEENSFTNGVGTSQAPFGLMPIHASENGFWTHMHTVGASLALVDLYAAEAAVKLRSRMNAAFFMSRAAIRAIQALETSGGQLFGGDYYNRVGYPQNSPSGNTGLRLLNYPIWEVPSAVYHLTTTKLNQFAFGDPKEFIIVDRVGMNIEIIPHIFTGAVPTGQRGLYAMWRNSAATFGAVGAPTTGGIRMMIA